MALPFLPGQVFDKKVRFLYSLITFKFSITKQFEFQLSYQLFKNVSDCLSS